MTTNTEGFIDKRRRLVGWWRIAGPACVIMVAALIAWTWFRAPLLVKPWQVIDRLENGSLEAGTLILLAAIAPMLYLVLLGMLVAVIALAWRAIAIERRYLRAIDSRPSG